MANLMSTPASWTDGYGASPPNVWTGTLYDFTGFDANINVMHATAGAGDTVDFDLTNLAASNAPAGLEVFINEVLVWSHSLAAPGSASYHSGPLSGGDVVRIYADVQDIAFYVVDFTLAVAAAPIMPVCGDVSGSENLATPQGTIVMTPVVTVSGTPVTPDSLTITEAPTHGTASVVGATLHYTPNAGIAGTDAFHYFATVSGLPSNTATANVEILVAPLARSIQKLNRLLADLYSDTTLDCYCRSDLGPLDLTGYDLTAHVHPYNRPQPFGQDYGVGWPGIYVPYHTEFPAEQVAVGHVQFTVDHGTIRQRLGSGIWRVNVVAVDPNTQARTRVYTALMTIQ